LRFAEIEPREVSVVECHGTGTALGDPIEVGALMAVMEDDRDLPLCEMSAKSNIGHLESAAGMAGLLKCVLMAQHSCAMPNVHIKTLNAHLESYGFPQIFESELIDIQTNSSYSGVSSFGFGGTNARGDVYGRALAGPRERTTVDTKKLDYISVTCPKCLGPMCWRCGVAIPTRTEKIGHHVCSLVRDEPNYDFCSSCYKGTYRHGTPVEDLDAWQQHEKVFIRGTWNGCKTMDEMEMVEDGVYVAYIRLSVKGWEHFQLAANSNPKELLYPAFHKAGPTARVLGPDDQGEKSYWLIDGRPLKVPAGTVYKVTFEWGERTRTISWDAISEWPADKAPLGTSYQPSCYVVGSWSRWSNEEMRPVPPSDLAEPWANAFRGLVEPCAYEFTFKIGERCAEEFQFLLDRDSAQAIYPAVTKAESSVIPVKGPGDRGFMKHFLVRGRPRELVTVTLFIAPGDGRVSLTAKTPSRGETTWRSSEANVDMYFITGSFTNWKMLPMASVIPGVCSYVASFEDSSEEEFQIVLDGDWDRTFHPSVPSAPLGESILQGPDGNGEGLHWCIHGEPFASYEITLDLNEPDRRRIVSWEKQVRPG
jgi:hypothetical protein